MPPPAPGQVSTPSAASGNAGGGGASSSAVAVSGRAGIYPGSNEAPGSCADDGLGAEKGSGSDRRQQQGQKAGAAGSHISSQVDSELQYGICLGRQHHQ